MSAAERHILTTTMGCTEETASRAMDLYRKAKYRTGPGSGREIGELHAGLLPICALIASEQLCNTEVTMPAAKSASSLKQSHFKRAEQIIRAALEDDDEDEGASYEDLLAMYVPNPLLRAQLEDHCLEVEEEVKKTRSMKGMTQEEATYFIFYWVAAAAKVDDLPEAQVYGKKHAVSGQRLANQCSKFTRALGPLRTRIIATGKAAMVSRTPSPTKQRALTTPTTNTPSRRQQPKRLLLTKESVKNTPMAATPSRPTPKASTSSRLLEADDEDDNETVFPETPTKKRRLESSPSALTPSTRLFHEAMTSSRPSQDAEPAFPIPQTPRRKGTRPVHGSPLKRTAFLPEEPMEDVVMEDADAARSDEDEHDDQEEDLGVDDGNRRFRPVYVEHRQWAMRGKRARRLAKVGEKRSLEYFTKHGNPFLVIAQ